MSSDFEKRLRAIERRLNAEYSSRPGAPMRIVIVHGCLPPGEPLFATAGAHEWLREPGEDLDLFCDRAAQAARELQEALLVIGGLPQSETQHELALAAYDAWLLTDDGVPPVTPARAAPARPRLGD
jgi:hypothetical protein